MPSLTVQVDTVDHAHESSLAVATPTSTLFVDSLDPDVPPCTIAVSAPTTPRSSAPLESQRPCSTHSANLTPTPTSKGFFRQGSTKVLHQLAKAQTSLKAGVSKLTPKNKRSPKNPRHSNEKSEVDPEGSVSPTHTRRTAVEKRTATAMAGDESAVAQAASPTSSAPSTSSSSSSETKAEKNSAGKLSLKTTSKKGKRESALCEASTAVTSNADGSGGTFEDVDLSANDSVPEEAEIVEKKHRDPNRVLLSSTVGGMTPYQLLGMILDKRFEVIMRKHKPAMGYRTVLKEGEYPPAKEPWHKENGHLVIVHSNKPESMITKIMRTAHAISYIKVPDNCNASSDSVRGTFKVVVPKFKRVVDVHGDMTITKLSDGRISVATDVYLKLNIPLIGGFVANFLRAQMKVGYKILPALVADYLELPDAPHPLETMKFD